jgi:vacuolar protein sorting-associated protein 13A/C
MSFSSLIADVASKFLGDYIEGFNAQNMEISLLNGSAVMKNLKLKRSLLDKFDLPMKITSSNFIECSIELLTFVRFYWSY